MKINKSAAHAINKFVAHAIKSSEQVKAKENLTNHKPWFNGPKKFSSVRIKPAKLEEASQDLSISVAETIKAKSVFGGKE